MANQPIRRQRPRKHSLFRDGAGLTSAEAAPFVRAWCTAVSRLTASQLREYGKPLFEVWFDHICGPDPRDEDLAVWNSLSPSSFGLLLNELVEAHRPKRKAAATPFDRRIAWLATTLGLDPVERAILDIIAHCALHDAWDKLLRALPGNGQNPSSLRIAYLTGLSPAEIEDRLAVGARLWRCGLIDNDGDGEFSANRLLQRIARANSSPARLARNLMPAAPRSSLQWSDFEHIGPQRDIAEALVATDHPAAILLYGPPGTGKTEFARLLADRTAKSAIFAGLDDENGAEPDRPERLAHLAVLRALTRGDTTRFVVMDEADDVLLLGEQVERGRRSKQFLNRMIEDGERPTIWIVNNVHRLEESLIRRMSLAIEFPMPPRSVRCRVVERHARMARVKLAKPEIERIASLSAAPAIIGNALTSAKAAGGGASEVLAIGEGLVMAISGEPPRCEVLPPCYDPVLALADTNLDALADRLERTTDPAWSLLLSGPSGTGKSAYARHLSERLGLDLLVKRGSDLLHPYVGMTEAHIAEAFREASRGRCLLLIDEADDFLADRRDAQRSWERSMVNQMLRQMEALEAPFVATTNLAHLLDPATQRRFTMRATFRALDEERARGQFRRWFDCEPPARAPLAGTTPGDFALVSRRAELLAERDPAVLARWLTEERDARGEIRVPIGFTA